MGYGKVGVSKERMCSYKLSHNSAVHTHSLNNPKSQPRIYNSSGFTLNITNSVSGAFTVPVLANTPIQLNAVPLFNDGLFRTQGTNFGLGVNRAGAKGIDNNGAASRQAYFRLLNFVIQAASGINLSDDDN